MSCYCHETTLHERPNHTKLTTIVHRTAFNNEQSPYRIVSYQRHRNDKCKTFQTRKLTA